MIVVIGHFTVEVAGIAHYEYQGRGDVFKEKVCPPTKGVKSTSQSHPK